MRESLGFSSGNPIDGGGRLTPASNVRPIQVRRPVVTHVPEQPERPPDRFSRRQRVFAGVLLVAFAAAAVLTTVLSLGAYCLTTDGADTRVLVETVRSLFQ